MIQISRSRLGGLDYGTLATSFPASITQTWNAGGVTFTGFKLVVTDTASAAASLLADFVVGSTSQFTISKAGSIRPNSLKTISDGCYILDDGNALIQMGLTWRLGWGSGSAGSTIDTTLVRDGVGIVAQKTGNADQTHRWYSSNAAYSQIQSLSELHTLAVAATSDTTITFPANSIGLGVTIRVTTLITGCTTLDVGIAGATTRYGTGIALTANTTNTGVGLTNPSIYAAATKVRFSAVGGGASFTAGVVRVTIHYISLSAPTS